MVWLQRLKTRSFRLCLVEECYFCSLTSNDCGLWVFQQDQRLPAKTGVTRYVYRCTCTWICIYIYICTWMCICCLYLYISKDRTVKGYNYIYFGTYLIQLIRCGMWVDGRLGRSVLCCCCFISDEQHAMWCSAVGCQPDSAACRSFQSHAPIGAVTARTHLGRASVLLP